MSPQPRGKLFTHGHGYEELDGEVDEEVHPQGGEAARRRQRGAPWWRVAALGAAAPLGAAASWPSFYLGDGAAMEDLLFFLGGFQGGGILCLCVFPSKTRVFSLYIGRDNASRHSDGWPLDPMALGHL